MNPLNHYPKPITIKDTLKSYHISAVEVPSYTEYYYK